MDKVKIVEVPVPRKLNMDEKRKLEKLLLQDIGTAETAYGARRSEQRHALEARMLRTPERAVQTALRNVNRAIELKKLAVLQLNALGYTLDYYEKLCIARDLPKPLRAFDAETRLMQKRLADAKRSYTMKLFAGGEEAQELFASLTRELASIIS